MNLSIEVLKETLKGHNPLVQGKNLFTREYMGIQCFVKGHAPLPQHYLLGTADVFEQTDVLENTCLISIGTPSQKILQSNLCLCLPSGESLDEVYHELLEMLYFYNDWERKLKNELQQNASLDVLCEISTPIFKKPMFIHDTTYERLASVNQNHEQDLWVYDSITGKYHHPQEIISNFKTSEEYLETLPTYGSQLFSAKTFGYPILYINLRIDDIYVGRICVCELGDTIKKQDYELLEFFADIIISAFKQGNILVRHSLQRLNQYFYEIINGSSISDIQLKRVLKEHEWDIMDPFLCATVYFQNPDYTMNIFEYLTRRFINTFLTACVFQNKGQLVIILNLRIYDNDTEVFFRELKELLREGLLNAGVSTIGYDFSNVFCYYKQANIAYQMGLALPDKQLLYYFEDYSKQYIFKQATQELLPEMLCVPQLLSLIKYDQKNKTEYKKTLECYLKNERNIKETSCELQIHRSTMNYRIERLHELLQLDLDNANVRLNLLLSFELLNI